jgi:hypothetical protein
MSYQRLGDGVVLPGPQILGKRRCC